MKTTNGMHALAMLKLKHISHVWALKSTDFSPYCTARGFNYPVLLLQRLDRFSIGKHE